MSVKKYTISHSRGNFTTIPNHVLQNLKNYEALGLYAYLLSLPPGWTFYKDYLRKHGDIGRNKLDNLLKILENQGLIKTAQLRNEKGAFAQFDLQVDDGTNFKINDLEKNAQPLSEKPLTVNGLPVNSIYKENNNKQINKKEISKSYCASDAAHAQINDALFDQFWNIYPRKKDKNRSREIWRRKRYDEIATLIFKDIEHRLLNDAAWQDDKFIPHPSTYLRNERWHDELTLRKPASKKETGAERALRLCLN